MKMKPYFYELQGYNGVRICPKYENVCNLFDMKGIVISQNYTSAMPATPTPSFFVTLLNLNSRMGK